MLHTGSSKINIIMIHYIYKIVHTNGRYYFGRHSTKNIDDGYIGSGKWIKSIKNKEEISKEIISYHDSFEELKEAEKLVLNEHVGKPLCMNFNNNPVGFASGDLNWSKTAEARKLKSDRKMGVTLVEEYGEERATQIRHNISKGRTGIKTGKPSWNSGVPQTEETVAKISESVSKLMSSMTPEERKEKYGLNGEENGFFNKKHSDITISHLRETQRKNRETKCHTCPHCGKTMYVANYAAHHGDKCKFNLHR